MSEQYRNIYQISREAAGFTQERAAELIDCSVESIRAYEGFKRVPPDTIVIKMIEIYDARYLAYQHLKTSAEVGQKYMPDITIQELPTALLRLQKEVTDYLKIKDELIEIACDGVIDEHERVRFNSILGELDHIVEAIYSLKFCK